MQAKDMTIQQLYNIFLKFNDRVNPFGATIQCVHESTSSGKPFGSSLATQANNLAGIKAGSSWTGKTVNKNTWEQKPTGEKYQTVAKFRAWDSVEDFAESYSSMVDRSYPLCAKDNFLGYFSGFFKGKYGAWATDLNYFNKLLTIAWNNSPAFFEDYKNKWLAVFVNAADRKLFVRFEHEEMVVKFLAGKVVMDATKQ